MLDFLTTEYSLTPEMRNLLASVSPRTIDRILKPVKDTGRLRGLSLTKPGNLLRDQIPVRVMFNWDERKPGFFEFDRAAHCGSDASGQFCQTLTGTDVGSGWTEEHALLNSAHPWVKERIQHIRDELPFPLLGRRGVHQPPAQRLVRPEPHPVHPRPSLSQKRQLFYGAEKRRCGA
jgi:hypothetical protein